MAGIQDHDYLRLCADLARRLGVSQAAARRRVEMAAAKAGETVQALTNAYTTFFGVVQLVCSFA